MRTEFGRLVILTPIPIYICLENKNSSYVDILRDKNVKDDYIRCILFGPFILRPWL
jgi:hypothetical protein